MIDKDEKELVSLWKDLTTTLDEGNKELKAILDKSQLAKTKKYVGNKNSKVLHINLPERCANGRQMNWHNDVFYDTLGPAHRAGYRDCFFCFHKTP